ncbi:antibiotic synthetase [Aspergillus sergii]|uniref:Antibiotic synthetase n=1 Tax=Aspergillus sergii TaxID=1034303 RepID=A0A5N6WHT7_9EURO|nr:antibiotic synthetase [Aspergillus sergii]
MESSINVESHGQSFNQAPKVVSKENSSGLAERIYNWAKTDPDHVAIETKGKPMTYSELHGHALVLSRRLLEEHAIAPEEAIGIITGSGYEQIIAQVTVVYAGGSCCGLDPTLPEAQLRYRLSNAGARICLTDKASSLSYGGYVNDLVKLVVVPNNNELPLHDMGCLDSPPPRALGLKHRSHLMHTSGSTGNPKTVEILARGIVHLASDDRVTPVGANDRTAQMSMVSFDISLFEIWVTLLRGATIVPLPRSLVKDVLQLARTWVELNITVSLVPASLLPMMVMAMPTVFSKMTVVYSGGEMPSLPAMRTVLENGPPKHMFNCYGPTECSIFSLIHEVTLEDTMKRIAELTDLVGETQIVILDEKLQRVPEGVVGELYIGGPGVARGYVNLPEKTAERFVTKHEIAALPPSCNFYATGDLASRDPSGAVKLLGRKDNQVKIRGFRIELEGVEAAIIDTGLVSVTAACKVQPDDNPMGAILVAFIQPKFPQSFSVDELRKAMKTEVADYLIPNFEVVQAMPLNGHGKVDRPKLVSDFLAKATKVQEELATEAKKDTTTICRLRRIWSSILTGYSGYVRENDGFLSLGGSSLQAAMLSVRIKREFRVQVTAVMVYEDMSLADMARYIDNGGEKYSIEATHNVEYRQDTNYYDTLHLKQPESQALAPQWHWDLEGRIFLTGATGFVGAFALQRLLSLPEVKSLICLVRAADDKAALARVRKIQDQYKLSNTPEEYAKLITVAGRLEDKYLGLGAIKFQQLAYWASCIFHLAAQVNYAQPYKTHRDANVVGTGNILRLQAAGRPKRLHYMSTLSIYGPTGLVDGARYVSENDSLMQYMNAVQHDNGYAQSKWVADKMVNDAIKDGCPATIYRPGAVFCHSQTGVGTPGDFVSRLMASSIQLGCFPIMPNQSKNFIPVDYLVDAMFYLSKQERSIGVLYNMCPTLEKQPENEMTESFRMLEEAIQVPLQELPYPQWLERLRSQDDRDPLRPLLPMLEEEVFESHSRWEMYENMPVYGTENLRRDLADEPSLADFPHLDPVMLRKFLFHLKLI